MTAKSFNKIYHNHRKPGRSAKAWMYVNYTHKRRDSAAWKRTFDAMRLKLHSHQVEIAKLLYEKRRSRLDESLQMFTPAMCTGRLTPSEPEARRLVIKQLKPRVGGDAGKYVLDLNYVNLEMRALAHADLSVKDEVTPLVTDDTVPISRDLYGQPVWPESLELKSGRHPLAGEKGKLCFRTACQRPEAWWYNRGSHHYYCEACARMLNRENKWDTFSDGKEMVVYEGPGMDQESALVISNGKLKPRT